MRKKSYVLFSVLLLFFLFLFLLLNSFSFIAQRFDIDTSKMLQLSGVVVSEEDCKTYDYNTITDMTEGTETIVHLRERIIGRTIQEDLFDTKGNTIIERGTLISEAHAKAIDEAGIKEVKFDRGGYSYHGKVKALADAAREEGLKF